MPPASDSRPVESPALVPDGWYPDPARQFTLRWWEHGDWTAWVSTSGQSLERPLPERRTSPRLATIPTRAVLWGVLGAVAATVAAGVAALAVEPVAGSLIAAQVALYGVLMLTVWLVSRRYGTGNLVADIGLRSRWIDVAGGLAAAVAARLVGVALVIFVLFVTDAGSDVTGNQFDAFESSDAAVAIALVLAVTTAPLFEEIYFRGFLQQALASRLGTSVAVVAQAVMFGAVHMSADNGTTQNLILLTVTGAAGLVFGFAFWVTKRLGTNIIAHALFNSVAVVVIIVQRWG